MTFAELYQLFLEVKPTLDERQLAQHEDDLWRHFLREAPPTAAGQTHSQRTSAVAAEFSKAINTGSYELRGRRSVLLLGEVAEPLWERILAKKLLVSTANTITRNAKIIGTDNSIGMKEALAEALRQYDALPYVVFLDGVPVRKSAQGHHRPVEKETRKHQRAVPSGTAKSDDYLAWQKIQVDVTALVERKVSDLQSMAATTIIREFMIGLKVLVHEAQTRVKRAVASQEESFRARQVPRHAIMSACQTLNMDYPSVGQPVNLDLAKRQKKILARLYHPDSHGGSDRTRLLYEAALAAYDLLETYNLQIGPNGETNPK